MAIRVRAQLRKWFGRGMYPTAEQFSDLFDSFFHKTEDKIPMSGVEGLTDQLNGKYNTAEGRELEKKVQKVTDDLSVHVASSEKAFNEVQNDIEALDGRLDTEIERAKGEEAAIRRELAAGDAATLSSAERSIRSRARAFPPRTTPPRRRPSWRESHRGRTTTGTRPPIRLR